MSFMEITQLLGNLGEFVEAFAVAEKRRWGVIRRRFRAHSSCMNNDMKEDRE
jgi:hypothetical protein